MPDTYTALFTHIVFGTHKCQRVLISSLRPRLWAYMGGIARENGIKPVMIGGYLDHAHLLVSLPSTMPVAKAVQLIKGGSSKWLHETFDQLRNFAWQQGYAAYSVGAAQLEGVSAYIAGQEQHHKMKTFEEEYLEFLKEYGIDYEERYLRD